MRLHLISALWLLLSCLPYDSTKAQSTDPFSVEDVLSNSFPTGMVSSSSGSKLAWVQNERGVRNIWIAQYPDFVGRQVTAYTGDDGQDISELTFTPDESGIFFVRGAGANRQGEFPNPALINSPISQEIRLLDLETGSHTKIADGRSIALSPEGKHLLFISKGQIWIWQDSDDPKQFLHTRGSAGSISWSPQGKRFAFVSNRGDHSFIGTYDFESEKIKYLSPSVDKDSNPVWSPDGSKVAFIRIPNTRNQLIFEPHREGLPWSIVVTDLASDNSEAVWEADEGTGSVFRGISASNQIFWSNNGFLVFPWEKYGWTNLFSLSLKDQKLTRLTKGEFEVQFVSLSHDANEVFYSSNENDIDRQHIWKSTMTGQVEQLTSGEGIEWWPVSLPQGVIASLASGPKMPAHATLWRNGKSQPLLDKPVVNNFPMKDLISPEQVKITASDGLVIHGQLFKSKKLDSNMKHPAVLFFHGGSRRQMLLGFHHRGYYHNAYALNQYLASQGYIVLSVNYRSGIGYGMEFREAENYGATGASEFNDVLGAGLYLKNRSDVDPDRIGLWGGSYGGYLTALGLSRASELFAAGVDIHGVHDWNIIIKNFIPSYNPNSRPNFEKLAFDSSPMAFIDTWKSPVLLIHGDDDRNVPFSESVDLAESLRKQNVEFEQLIFPDEVHGFLLHQNWVDAYKATADFFDRKLKGKVK